MKDNKPVGTVSVAEILTYLDQAGDRYIGKRDAAAYLGISPRLLDQHRRDMPHFRLGHKLLFKKSELDRWMEHFRPRPVDLDLAGLLEQAVKEALGPEAAARRARRSRRSAKPGNVASK